MAAAFDGSDIQPLVSTSMAQRTGVCGFRQVTRQVAQGNAQCVILAEDTSEGELKKIVEAICKENKVPCINVSSKELLGQWAGLAKIDDEGEVVKARPCSSVCINRIPNTPAGEKLKAYISASSA